VGDGADRLAVIAIGALERLHVYRCCVLGADAPVRVQPVRSGVVVTVLCDLDQLVEDPEFQLQLDAVD